MRCVTVYTVVLALFGALLFSNVVQSQFLNNRPFPTYSLEHMPDTSFTCRDKVLGGYYADSETQCQMFHVCVKVAGLGVQDFRFLCPNGTAFDQDSQICAEWDDVDCEAATLYYSSDNFDLYRVGSGFETAPFPGEDEGTFHLQRSETGDARLNREHQSQRVNQKTEYNTAAPPKRPTPHQHHRPQQQQQPQRQQQQQQQQPQQQQQQQQRQQQQQQQSNHQQSNQQQQDRNDREFLRGSSSSNFFNNRNGGKENDDDYYDNQGAPNQNSDIPKKKVVRKFQNRKPVENDYEPEARTSRPSRPTGFVNNFAGSVNPPSTTTIRTTPQQPQQPQQPPQEDFARRRPIQRNRGNERHYNNAENFRNNNDGQYNTRNNNEGQYNSRNNNDGQYNSRNDNTRNQYTVSTPAPFRAPSNRQTTQYNNYDNGQYSTTSAPTQKATATRQNFNQQYQTKQTENYPSTPIVPKQTFQKQQTENYPSTSSGNFNQYNKQTENYPSTPIVKKVTENYPSTASPFKQTEYNKPTTQFKKTEPENYPTTANFNKQTFNNYDQKKQTTFKQTENYPTTFAPKNYPKQQSTQYYQPKETENYPTTKQQSQNYNTQQFDSTRNQFPSSQNSPTTQHSTTIRPTTQHTQYTPTVPKQTTQYYSTTPVTQRFSKQFDETQYDDGSYNAKYDDEKYRPDDEFLKTAHSQNFASARNEFASSTKITTQSPRPFSATTPLPKTTQQQRQQQTQTAPRVTQQQNSRTTQQQNNQQYNNQQSQKQVSQQPQQPPQAKPQLKKKEKDVSYDYAYYDSSVGSEPDYDIGTEFAKSTKKTN